MSSIKLMLIDNYKIIRTGLRMLLQAQPDIEVVAETSVGAEAAALAQVSHLDVILMTVTTLGMKEMGILHQLKAYCPSVAILALTILETIRQQNDYFFQIFNTGASGCIPNQATPEDLLRAIRTVYRGEFFFHSAVVSVLVKNFLQRRWGDLTTDSPCLTKREQEILILIAEGLTNEQIGGQLAISSKTVASYQYNITQKLDLSGRVNLARYAIQKGLISL